MIKFEVEGQRLVCHLPTTTSDTLGYIQAEATFSSDWDGTDKWLHLKDQYGQTYDYAFKNGLTATLSLTSGRWEAWCHGTEMTNGQPTVRIVTTTVSFDVTQSGMLQYGPLPEIPPSAAEQIAANSAYAVEQVDQIRKEWEVLAPQCAASAKEAKLSSLWSKSWAVGGTGLRPYVVEMNDNSKHYSEVAKMNADESSRSYSDTIAEREKAEKSATEAKGYASQAKDEADRATWAKSVAEQASQDANISKQRAENEANRAESERAGAEGAKQGAEAALAKAEDAAIKAPIERDGNWWVWDFTQNTYVDTGRPVSTPGDSGVAYGPTEPTDPDKMIWINGDNPGSVELATDEICGTYPVKKVKAYSGGYGDEVYIDANVYNVLDGTVYRSLAVMHGASGARGRTEEYCLEFKTAANFSGQVTFNMVDVWANEFKVEPNHKYQVSVLNGVGIIAGVEWEESSV